MKTSPGYIPSVCNQYFKDGYIGTNCGEAELGKIKSLERRNSGLFCFAKSRILIVSGNLFINMRIIFIVIQYATKIFAQTNSL